MAMTIMNNTGTMLTLRELNKNNSKLGKQLKKVSSGMRVIGAADDASGYSISERMRVRIRSLSQADNNTQTGTSMIRIAEGAIQNQLELLKTVKEKVLDANNDSNTDMDRATIQKEIDLGYQQMEDIAYETNYNGIRLLSGGDLLRYAHTNWSKEPKPEFGVHDHETDDISPLITKTVQEDKSGSSAAQSRVWTGMNQQPLDPHAEELDSTDSVYDAADPYHSGIASIQSTIGTVANNLSMSGGVNWQAAKNQVSIDTSGMTTSEQVLNSLKNRRFTVTLGTETAAFVFADDLTSNQDFSYDYSYEYKDSNGDTQTKNASSTVNVAVSPTVSYSSGEILISLQGIKNLSGVTDHTSAANWALGRLADAIASEFGTYTVGGSATQSKIYGDSISDGVLTLASGEYDFSVSVDNETPASYTDSGLAARIQSAANSAVGAAAAADYTSISGATEGPLNPQVTSVAASAITSVNGTGGSVSAVSGLQEEQFAYTDVRIDDLINGTTDIEDMIEKFLFKDRDDELNAADADPTDRDIFDTGNNRVVDKSFTFSGYYGGVTYEFIDTGRDNTGKQYLYDDQKISGSQTVDLNRLRTLYNTNGGNLKEAVAQFLYDAINYTSYGRNESYTRKLLKNDGAVTDAANADKIRFYAYQPYAGTNSSSGGALLPSSGSGYMQSSLHRHYGTGRYAGTGAAGNNYSMETDETYLCSYDLDLKAWWAANIGEPSAEGNDATAEALQDRLNQRGFRFYCPAHNTSDSLKEWVNIYFTDHSIEEDIYAERPKAGESPLETGDKIDTIVVDVRNIKNYKELVEAIYKQANPASKDGASVNVGQVGYEGNPLSQSSANTDYFSHFLFAMDKDNGILTIYDTDRYAHGTQEMYVSDGVYDNIRLEVREQYEQRLIIHDTDHDSQAIAVHIPRTTMDYVFGFNPAKGSLSDYTVLQKDMREQLLGKSKDSIGILDRGLNYLINANCLLGAQINRLSYSHSNLVTSVENTVSSESTIRDADMAKEMTEYVKANVLLQSSQSMLAQANQNSSQILGLLQ